MKKTTLLTTLATALALFSTSSFAANVPTGTKLAEVQEYRQALAASPTTIDVNAIQEIMGYQLTAQLFEPLVVFNEKGKLQPGVAKSWTHSDDYKVWRFNLRHDAKWSDGHPLVAEDFVTSFRRLLDPNNGYVYAFYLGDLNVKNARAINEGKVKPEELGVKALDDHTLEITLDSPVPWFLQAAALTVLSPIPTHLVKEGKWPNFDDYVSNGPYRLESQVANDSYVFVRNKNYWNDKETVINKATFFIVPQDTAAYKRLQSGELDALKVSSTSLIQLAAKDDSITLLTEPSTGLNYLMFNLKKEPFANKDLRRAIQLAIDTKVIEDKVLKDNVIATSNYVPSSIPGSEELTEAPYFTQPMSQRIAEARQLVAKAGYSKANPLEVTYSYTSNNPRDKILALAIQAQLKRAFQGSVVLNLKSQEWKSFLTDRTQGKFDIATAGWGADYLEPSTFASIWTCNSAVNAGHYCNPAYEDKFNALFFTKTDAERNKLYAQMNTILQQDVAGLPLYAPKQNWAINPKLKGLSVDDNFRRVVNFYFVK